MTARDVADELHVDVSTAWRRLRQAVDEGLVENTEERPRQPGRYLLTDREPESAEILPDADVVKAELERVRNRKK